MPFMEVIQQKHLKGSHHFSSTMEGNQQPCWIIVLVAWSSHMSSRIVKLVKSWMRSLEKDLKYLQLRCSIWINKLQRNSLRFIKESCLNTLRWLNMFHLEDLLLPLRLGKTMQCRCLESFVDLMTRTKLGI